MAPNHLPGSFRFVSSVVCVFATGVLGACTDRLPTPPPAVDGSMPGAPSEVRVSERQLNPIALGDLGGGMTSAFGINNRGEVVGTSTNEDGIQRAFLWTAREGMRDLGGLSDGPAAALDINNAGDVVGWSVDGDGERRATRWPGGGAIMQLPHPDAGDGETPASAIAINSRGDAVGVSHGDIITLWPRGGGVEVLPCPRGLPFDISDSGIVVGVASEAVGATVLVNGGSREFSGFVLTPRDPVCRGVIDDSFLALDATGVNARGDIVGSGGEWEPFPPFLSMLTVDIPFVFSDRRGFRTDGDLPDVPRAINNRGTVVGDEVEAINEPGDRVGGSWLWTSRPNAFRSLHAEMVAPSMALEQDAPAVTLSAEVEAGLESCPEAVAHMVRVAALPSCPLSTRR